MRSAKVKTFCAYGLPFSLLTWLLFYFLRPNLPVLNGPIPVPAEYARIHGQTTVLIKTMNRREKVALLVKSIETLYPRRFKILIGDDGERDEGDVYRNEGILERERIRYFWFGFDIGVSAGRNRLVSLCDTKYAINMDDDMFWTTETNIYNLFRVFEETKADIITMSIVNDGVKATYLGELYIEKNSTPAKIFCKHTYPPPLTFIGSDTTTEERTQRSSTAVRTYGNSTEVRTHRRTPQQKRRTHRRIPLDVREQCYQTEVGFTMFLSTRSFLASNPWKGVIGQEHIEWFWDMKHRDVPARVVGCLNITVIHNYRGYSKIWDFGYWSGYRAFRGRFKVNSTNYWNYLAEDDPKCSRLGGKINGPQF